MAHNSLTKDYEMLCKNTVLPNLSLDNLWALIHIIENEDIESCVAEYFPACYQRIHPFRGNLGKPGYVLDRPMHRFILDIAVLFGMPRIYDIFDQRIQDLNVQLALTPHMDQLRLQEIRDLKESMTIFNHTL